MKSGQQASDRNYRAAPDYQEVGLELIGQIKNNIRMPFVAIGGINENNLKKVLNAGVKNVVMISQIISKENIEEEIIKLQKYF